MPVKTSGEPPNSRDSVLTYLSDYLEFDDGQPGPEFAAICPDPEHDDTDPSFYFNIEEGVGYCHGCGLSGNVLQLAGRFGWKHPPFQRTTYGLPLTWTDKETYSHPISEWYRYRNIKGEVLYAVARVEYSVNGKKVKQFPVFANGRWGFNGQKRTLYNLDKLDKTKEVFIVEGEKDANSLTEIGFTATCNLGGAGKWKPTYANALKDKDVFVLPDNDDPGRDHAETVAKSLDGKAASVKVVALPNLPEKGDVSDWLEGKDPQKAKVELDKLVGKAKVYKVNVYQPVRESDFFTRQIPQPQEIVEGLIREQDRVILAGPYCVGKSPAVLDLACHVIWGRPWCGRSVTDRQVIYFDFENSASNFVRNVQRTCDRMGRPYPNVHGQMEVYLESDDMSRPGTKTLFDVLNMDWRERIGFLEERLKEKPRALIIIDPAQILFWDVDLNKGKPVTEVLGELKKLLSRFPEAAILSTFNLRKLDQRAGGHRPDLFDNPRNWLEEVSGVNYQGLSPTLFSR